MDALGWSLIENGPYASWSEWEEETFSVYVTDLGSIWCEHLTIPEISKRCQECNPLIEAKEDVLIKQLQSCLTKSLDDTLKIEKHEDRLSLKIKSTLGTFPFAWKFSLTLQATDQFRDFIAFPLITLLREASLIQEELCNIIRKKDKQIDDYKASGAAVSRRNLETLDFDEKKFYDSRLTSSVMGDASAAVLFCQILEKFKKPYSELIKQTKRKNLAVDTKTISSHEEETHVKIEDKTDEKQIEIEEQIRLDQTMKRLRKEEENTKTRTGGKKRLRLVL